MSRMKLVVLSMLSVIVASAVMASSASAEGESCSPEVSKDTVICIDKIIEPKPGVKELEKLEFEGLMGTSDEVAATSILKSELFKIKETIECKKILVIIIVEDSGKAKIKITLLECKATKGPCTLTAGNEKEIKAEGTGEVVAGTTTGEVKFTGSGAGELFTTIETTNCGNLEVKGSQTCTTENPDVGTEEKEGVCALSGSKLKLGTEKAEFEVKVPGIEIIDKAGKLVDSEAAFDGAAGQLNATRWWFGKS
jgi:hypothetical protein